MAKKAKKVKQYTAAMAISFLATVTIEATSLEEAQAYADSGNWIDHSLDEMTDWRLIGKVKEDS